MHSPNWPDPSRKLLIVGKRLGIAIAAGVGGLLLLGVLGILILLVYTVVGPRVDTVGLETEMRQELPVGTPGQQVEDYLKRKEIGYGYAPAGDVYYALVPNIRPVLLGEEDLQIRIYVTVDYQRRVKRIEFEENGSGL